MPRTQPIPEPVKMKLGFITNSDATSLIVEDVENRRLFELKFDRRDLGDLLSSRVDIDGELKVWNRQKPEHRGNPRARRDPTPEEVRSMPYNDTGLWKNLKLRLVSHTSGVPGTWWKLVRVDDNRHEASGFASEEEAREWAKELGHEIVEVEVEQ